MQTLIFPLVQEYFLISYYIFITGPAHQCIYPPAQAEDRPEGRCGADVGVVGDDCDQICDDTYGDGEAGQSQFVVDVDFSI